eukprot:gene10064-2234_t
MVLPNNVAVDWEHAIPLYEEVCSLRELASEYFKCNSLETLARFQIETVFYAQHRDSTADWNADKQRNRISTADNSDGDGDGGGEEQHSNLPVDLSNAQLAQTIESDNDDSWPFSEVELAMKAVEQNNVEQDRVSTTNSCSPAPKSKENTKRQSPGQPMQQTVTINVRPGYLPTAQKTTMFCLDYLRSTLF